MAEQSSKSKSQGTQGESKTMATRSEEGERSLAIQYQDPLSLFDSMFERMQRDMFGTSLFNTLLAGRTGEGNGPTLARVPRMQMRDTGDAIVLTAELPGIEPDDLQLEFANDVLTIHGESEIEEETDGAQVTRAICFHRQMRLPEDIDVDQAEASYRNGILSIRLPKRVERSNVKQIPISTGQQPAQQPGQPQAQQQAKEKAA
jgi:HSP20 family protein